MRIRPACLIRDTVVLKELCVVFRIGSPNDVSSTEKEQMSLRKITVKGEPNLVLDHGFHSSD
jgi:hypothetical protein